MDGEAEETDQIEIDASGDAIIIGESIRYLADSVREFAGAVRELAKAYKSDGAEEPEEMSTYLDGSPIR